MSPARQLASMAGLLPDMKTVMRTDAASLADPYEYFAMLRRDAPVAWDAEHGFWLISTYADVLHILTHPEEFSSHVGPTSQLGAPWMPSEDAPLHTRLRHLVSQAFTPRRIAGLAPRMEEITRLGIETMRSGDGRADVVQHLSFPLPITVIAELIGIPPTDQERIWQWSFDFMQGLERGSGWKDAVDPILRELKDYFQIAIDERRAVPGDDLISALLAGDPVDGSRLSDGELFNMCLLLMVAGNETTTNLISNALAAMATYPEVYERVQADHSLVPGWVEESLRWDSSVRALFRVATQGVVVRGQEIQAGETLLLLLGSANRDESVFEAADEFIPERDPKRHLAFGIGKHHCLGAPLARLEANIALRQVAAAFKSISFDPDHPYEREDLLFTRGYRSLPLMFSS